MDEEIIQLPIGDGSSLVRNYSLGVPFFPKVDYDSILPRSYFTEVPHVRQLCNWDCGLACVLMVLRTLGIDHCDIHSLGKLCSTTSIWTVDLAYLLHKFSITFTFLTVTLGANPEFSVETFYKEQLPNDLGRVDSLFQKALEAGINIQCSSISGQEISILILSGKYIAVALVDKYKLSRSWLEDIYVSGCYVGNSGYTGHYVVICGYDADAGEFEIRDPASSRLSHEYYCFYFNGSWDSCYYLTSSSSSSSSSKSHPFYFWPALKYERVSMECLDEARKSFGTDEDILLVSLDRREGENKLSASLHFNKDSLQGL